MGTADRKKVGFLFFFDEAWMGGIIYVANSIRILNYLEDKDKPEVFVFYSKKIQDIIDEINYPYLNLILTESGSIPRIFIKSIIVGKNLFVDDIIKKYDLDDIFPMHYFPVKEKRDTKLVAWFADLQYKHYPEFFTKRKIIESNLKIKYILSNAKDLVVSSQAVKEDFYKFFKIPATLNIHIYRFVSIIDGLPDISPQDLLRKYKLPAEYFMVSNQFHKHKNHKVLLKALSLLKQQGSILHVAMTGKFPNQPDSPYMQELHDLININGLKSQISFLGLIPRGEQLLLMKNTKAIIQPSLFEGWSTVIEDARSLQVPVIASDLAVNIEQLGDKGSFFPAHDYKKLASYLIKKNKTYDRESLYKPYEQRMKEAAYSFYSIFTSEDRIKHED